MDHFRLIFRTGGSHGIMGDCWIEVCLNCNGPENQPVLTHGWCSPKELECQVADLKAELDAIVREARAKSKKHLCAKAAQREE
jgi:hypothetical protein